MNNYSKTVWNAILDECSKMMEKDSALVMYHDSETLFHENFTYYYTLIVDKFMKSYDKHLDRHKIAAVIICSILKSEILGISCNHTGTETIDDIFLANEKLALNIALSDMYQRLVSECEEGKLPYNEVFPTYVFPTPLSCDRDYTEVICRDLYFCKKYFELDPLSIANFLFLLEAYSFEAFKIQIDESKWNALNDARRKEQLGKDLKSVEDTLSRFDNKVENEKKELEGKKAELQRKLSQYEI